MNWVIHLLHFSIDFYEIPQVYLKISGKIQIKKKKKKDFLRYFEHHAVFIFLKQPFASFHKFDLVSELP